MREPGAHVLALGGVRVLLRRATLAEILPLRHAELRPGLPRARAEFAGDADPTTRHFGAFVVAPGGAPAAARDVVGCASLVAQPWRGAGDTGPGAAASAYQLRGMATRADLTRRGIGGALLRNAIADLVAGDHARLFWCNARVGAVEFYRRMGWRVASDVFDVPSVGPHRAMTFVASQSAPSGAQP